MGLNTLHADLEELRQDLPEPFRYSEELERFFQLDKAQSLTNDGRESAQPLLEFIRKEPEADLIRVAVLLLSQLDPSLFYEDLVSMAARADRSTVMALEAGLWRIQVDPSVVAADLVASVDAERPNALLLLQRPVAQEIKPQLIGFVRQDIHPLSLYAMYCLEYTIDNGDRGWLVQLTENSDIEEIRSLASSYLNQITEA